LAASLMLPIRSMLGVGEKKFANCQLASPVTQ
jgi:hypothetical protein